MIITICEGYDNSYVTLISKNDEFIKRFGNSVQVPASRVYRELEKISVYVNNELGEECLFEVG